MPYPGSGPALWSLSTASCRTGARTGRRSLLAQNRISPRRAAVLAYISSLLLRTLPAIAADNAAGTTYPTEPVPVNVLVADKDLGPDEDPDLDSGSDPRTDPETQTKTEGEAHKDSTNAWNPSCPDPDPTKKPS